MSYFLISNNHNDVNNSLNNNDDDYKLSISAYLSGLLKVRRKLIALRRN